MTRILGIDPGSKLVGYGLLACPSRRQAVLVTCGVLKARAKDGRLSRLVAIARDLDELVREFEPDVVAVELAHVIPGREGAALVIAEARGLVIAAAARLSVAVAEFRPAQIKRVAAGKGNASKQVVAAAMRTRFGVKPKHLDTTDAIAIALTCAVHGGPL